MRTMTEERGLIRGSRILQTAVATLCAGAFALGGMSVATAQDASPPAAPEVSVEVDLMNQDGEKVGAANLTEFEGAVAISLTVDDVAPGPHGLHIHETGVCDPSGDEPFSSAGGHFNPTDASHGAGPAIDGTPAAATPADTEAHAGDLGNITVDDDGTVTVVVTTNRVTLGDGENSLADEDGSALVIHEGEDDLMTDPSGESGPRIACGVIYPPQDGTPVASDDTEQR
jgi:superoxide dismutase, Cu-Zn family